jgi:20S proteasome alpha/beta subunit
MPGFDFSNHNRNLALHAQGVPLPKATSTGTTIVGCIYDGGVVIAADTRATSGPIVADKVGFFHSKRQKELPYELGVLYMQHISYSPC